MTCRVGIVCDIEGEEWPSMDLVAEQLLRHLGAGGSVTAVALRAPTTWRLARLPIVGSRPRVRTLDRLVNRYRDYPRWLAAHQAGLDVFHIVDHSYAHLVAQLPAGATIVTCHDLDAFRPVLQPTREPRPRWFRALVERTLSGLRQAARVACVSTAVRDELAGSGLVEPARLRVVPNGVDAVMRPQPDAEADRAAGHLLGPASSGDILHVGSAITRKRIDVLLRAFAHIRAARPDARLIRVGGLQSDQRALAASLGVADGVIELPFLDRRVLASVYRRSTVLVFPSEREGFGLPVLEALACGTPVVTSDISSLRETGGEAACYAPAGDDGRFAELALTLIAAPSEDRRQRGLEHAAGFTWPVHAARMEALYREVA